MLRLNAILALAALPAAAADSRLSNAQIVAHFDSRGLTSITDRQTHVEWNFRKDDFAVAVGGRTWDSARLDAPAIKSSAGSVAYTYLAGPYTFQVVYELRPKWRLVSKQISILEGPAGKLRLDEITVFGGSVAEAVREAAEVNRARANLGTSGYGAFLRSGKSASLLVTAQNPFLSFRHTNGDFALSYQPGMEWDLAWGPFEADRGLLVACELTGRTLPEKMLPEWAMGPLDDTPGLDEGEVDGFTEAVRAFLLYQPVNPLNLMVGWCVNDYQIDIATAEGRTEYKRILDMAAALGAEHVLFAPANSELSRRDSSRDDWKWEYVLWLGLGQKIRNNQWDPATGDIPASLAEMLDYARLRRLQLLAYVYPVMGFSQNPEWLLAAKGTRANLGVRSFQDWLIQALEDFMKHTGISGYSFDHTFLNYEGASRYAQWWGWRRVLETLRRDIPDIVIDGRQAYQYYGPWTWLAGSYPHPTSTDEQPESFNSFPDLKLDRVSADRQRYTAYRYRNYEFAPSEIVPGFITHQTPRNDDSGHMPVARTATDEVALPFRRRDWDYLGWRYSLLSSIATAGWNNVIDMVPARDPEEFRHFPLADREWFLHWIDWSDANKDYLRHTRTILGQPAIGKVDGTSAIIDDSGFVFLFNPNGRRLEARFTLDESIGLKENHRAKFILKELYPLEDRLLGKPGAGAWSWDDAVAFEMDGGSARVFEIEPDDRTAEIRLFNVPGTAVLEDGVLRLHGVRGETGMAETILVRVPGSAKIDSIEIGTALFPAPPARSGLLEIPVRFEGAPFRHYQQVDRYDPAFTGGGVHARFRIPRRIFDQLEARRKSWPIPWTEEDYRSTWLAPERLLLYVQFAEPDDRWTATLKIDGQPVELRKAYASVRVSRHNFTGFYADISKLAADVEHTLELDLPSPLKPGQFQGVFFENIETGYTSGIVR